MHTFPDIVTQAVQKSIFAQTSRDDWAPLFAGGMLIQIPAGMRAGDSPDVSRVVLVCSGTFRMFYTDESGKQLTVRYIHPGEIMGIVAAIGGHFPLEVEALEEAIGWVISGEQIREVAARNARLAWAIAQECATRLAGVFAELTTVAFGSIRDRLIRHLLKLAETRPLTATENINKGEIFVRASQQELADAVGTSREVIARALRELRDGGLLQHKSEIQGTLAIPDVGRLHRALAASLAGE